MEIEGGVLQFSFHPIREGIGSPGFFPGSDSMENSLFVRAEGGRFIRKIQHVCYSLTNRNSLYILEFLYRRTGIEAKISTERRREIISKGYVPEIFSFNTPGSCFITVKMISSTNVPYAVIMPAASGKGSAGDPDQINTLLPGGIERAPVKAAIIKASACMLMER